MYCLLYLKERLSVSYIVDTAKRLDEQEITKDRELTLSRYAAKDFMLGDYDVNNFHGFRVKFQL